MFTFTPMTDEEIEKAGLLESGRYNFEVMKAERQTSQKGNPMAKMMLKVWDKVGGTHIVYDYLVFSSVAMNMRKISHFCQSVGLYEEYQRGALPEDLAHYCGEIEIGVEEGKEIPLDKLNGKPAGTKYPAKNNVVDYLVCSTQTKKSDNLASKENAEAPFFNDSIPF